MIEKYYIRGHDTGYLGLYEEGLCFKFSKCKVKTALCPKCGYLENYIDSPDIVEDARIEEESIALEDYFSL